MINRTSSHPARAVMASVLALGLAAQAQMACAQSDYDQRDDGPPSGQYAPPPDDAYANSTYDDRAQQRDQAYADSYSRWADRYCVQQRQNDAAAGAVVGGVLGALLGSGIAGRGNHTGGAIVGGAVGATAGAAIGANSGSQSSCPQGYVVTNDAPAFYYQGYTPVYGPSWYNPWIFVGGRWTYRPYRAWYYNHPSYWRRDDRDRHRRDHY